MLTENAVSNSDLYAHRVQRLDAHASSETTEGNSCSRSDIEYNVLYTTVLIDPAKIRPYKFSVLEAFCFKI